MKIKKLPGGILCLAVLSLLGGVFALVVHFYFEKAEYRHSEEQRQTQRAVAEMGVAVGALDDLVRFYARNYSDTTKWESRVQETLTGLTLWASALRWGTDSEDFQRQGAYLDWKQQHPQVAVFRSTGRVSQANDRLNNKLRDIKVAWEDFAKAHRDLATYQFPYKKPFSDMDSLLQHFQEEYVSWARKLRDYVEKDIPFVIETDEARTYLGRWLGAYVSVKDQEIALRVRRLRERQKVMLNAAQEIMAVDSPGQRKEIYAARTADIEAFTQTFNEFQQILRGRISGLKAEEDARLTSLNARLSGVKGLWEELDRRTQEEMRLRQQRAMGMRSVLNRGLLILGAVGIAAMIVLGLSAEKFVNAVLKGIRALSQRTIMTLEATEKIRKISRDYLSRIREQSLTLGEASGHLEEISSVLQKSERDFQQSQEAAEATLQKAGRGQDALQDIQISTGQVSVALDKLQESVRLMEETAEQISSLTAQEGRLAAGRGPGAADLFLAKVQYLSGRMALLSKSVLNDLQENMQTAKKQSDIAGDISRETETMIQDIHGILSGINGAAQQNRGQIKHISAVVASVTQIVQMVQTHAQEVATQVRTADELSGHTEILQEITDEVSALASEPLSAAVPLSPQEIAVERRGRARASRAARRRQKREAAGDVIEYFETLLKDKSSETREQEAREGKDEFGMKGMGAS